MNKYLYPIFGLVVTLLSSCGGSDLPPFTLVAPVTVDMSDITTCQPRSNISFSMAVAGGGAFRMNDAGTVTEISGGTFEMEISNNLYACTNIPTYSGYIITSAGNRLTGYGVNADGTLSTSLSEVNVFGNGDMAPSSTRTITAAVEFDSRVPLLSTSAFDPANPATYHFTQTLNVYDSLGNAHVLRIFYLRTAAMTWHVFGKAEGTTLDIEQLTFNADGALESVLAVMSVALPISNGATTPLTMKFDSTGSTEHPSAFRTISFTQDGYTRGIVNGFSIDIDGKITSRYTNGQTRLTGAVALVSQ